MGRKKKHNPYLLFPEQEETRIGLNYGQDSGYGSYGGYGVRDYYSNYNWGQYSNYSYHSDYAENQMMVKEPTGYATPNSNEIDLKLRRIGHISTKNNEYMVADFARFFYYQMVGDTAYMKPEMLRELTTYKSTFKKASSYKELFDEKWNAFVPGNTPLDKAITLFQELASKEIAEGEVPEFLIDKLEGTGISERVFKDAIYNQLADKMTSDPGKKLSVLAKLSLIQDFGKEFKVEKETVDKLAANSRLTAQKMLSNYSQLNMVEAYQRLLPNYQAKLLTKNLIIKAHIERIENKQKIIMLVDYSGSMRNNEKQEWVQALMIDRLKYVMQGEAEVFFSYFVCDPDKLHFTHLHDSKSALDFWSRFRTTPNGDETDMGSIVDHIGEEIRSRKFHNLNVNLSEENPEILIINDGNDSVHADEFTYKTNALTLMGDNGELRDLCQKNGGKYIHITDKAQVVYS